MNHTKCAYRVDIDNTITAAQFYDPNVQACIQHSIQAGIVTREETAHVQYHPQLYTLPQVAMTHQPLPEAVESLRFLAQVGASLQYFTLRQSFDEERCKCIHENTHLWLDLHAFPHPRAVRFFWNLTDKLLAALEAQEPYIALIDDRPSQLLQVYQKLAEHDPQSAQQIRERAILVGFWCAHFEQVPLIAPAPRMIPLADWSHFKELLARLVSERKRENHTSLGEDTPEGY